MAEIKNEKESKSVKHLLCAKYILSFQGIYPLVFYDVVTVLPTMEDRTLYKVFHITNQWSPKTPICLFSSYTCILSLLALAEVVNKHTPPPHLEFMLSSSQELAVATPQGLSFEVYKLSWGLPHPEILASSLGGESV